MPMLITCQYFLMTAAEDEAWTRQRQASDVRFDFERCTTKIFTESIFTWMSGKNSLRNPSDRRYVFTVRAKNWRGARDLSRRTDRKSTRLNSSHIPLSR